MLAMQVRSVLAETAGDDVAPPRVELRPPQVLHSVQASYPEDALRDGVEGRVVLELLISSEGRVELAEVVEGLTPSLNAAAREALLGFQFAPARVGGIPRASRIRYAYDFVLPHHSDDVPLTEPTVAAPRQTPVEPFTATDQPSPTTLQEADDSSGSAEVVVRGYREGTRLRRSAAAVTVVDLTRAKRESGDMGTVLSRAEGVSVQQAGGLGSSARFNLAGFDDTQVRFFIDGIPLEYQGFALGIQNVPLHLAERIDIFKGVVPIQFGADTLGGAFNLVTDRSAGGAHLSGSYQAGSFDTHRATASVRYLDPATGLFFKGEGFYDTTDNDYPMDVEVGDRTGQTQTKTVRRFHDSYTAQGSNVELGLVNVGWARRLLLRAFATSYDKDLQHNARMTTPYGAAAFGGFASGLSLRHEHDLGFGLSSSLVVGYTYDRSDFVDTPGDCVYSWLGECRPQRRDMSGELRDRSTDQSLWDHTGYARWSLKWEIVPGHEVGLATAPTHFRRSGKDHLIVEPDAFKPLSGKRESFKWISGAEYRVTNPTEQLENVSFFKSYLNTAQSDELLTKTTNVERSAQRVYWGAGNALRYAFNDWAIAKSSYEYSVRLPEPREIFGNGAQIGENLDLRAERSHNVNVTLLMDGLETPFGRFDASTTGFYRDAVDLVLLLGRAEIFYFENVFRARVAGAEAGATWTDARDIVELSANAAYQDLRNLATSGAFAPFEGDRIPNKPYFFANGRARLQAKALARPSDVLSFTWYTRYVHRFFRTWASVGLAEERPVIDSQLVHTAIVTYADEGDSGRGVSFSLEAQNLWDAKVFDFYGIQRPGRAVFFKTVFGY